MVQTETIGYAENKEVIARRIARFFKTGDIVNLGIGLPTLVGNYIPRVVTVILQSENGVLGLGPSPEPGMEDKDLTNAGSLPATILPGGAFSIRLSVLESFGVAMSILPCWACSK